MLPLLTLGLPSFATAAIPLGAITLDPVLLPFIILCTLVGTYAITATPSPSG